MNNTKVQITVFLILIVFYNIFWNTNALATINTDEIVNADGVKNSSQNIDLNEKSSIEQQLEDGTYVISSAIDNNMVLDIEYLSTAENANLELHGKNGQNNQKFKVKYIGEGYYTLEVVCSAKLLTVYKSGTLNCTNVVQNTDNGSDSQKWLIQEAGDGYYYIISKCNGLYLDIEGGISYNGANLDVYTGHNGLNQKFKFNKVEVISGEQTIANGTYMISSALDSRFVLDIAYVSTANNANLELYSKNGQNNQKFKVTYTGDGYYTLEVVFSSKLITVYESGIKDCTNVVQYSNNGTDSQKWVIKDAGGGYYYIISKCNGLYLDIEGRNDI